MNIIKKYTTRAYSNALSNYKSDLRSYIVPEGWHYLKLVIIISWLLIFGTPYMLFLKHK